MAIPRSTYVVIFVCLRPCARSTVFTSTRLCSTMDWELGDASRLSLIFRFDHRFSQLSDAVRRFSTRDYARRKGKLHSNDSRRIAGRRLKLTRHVSNPANLHRTTCVERVLVCATRPVANWNRSNSCSVTSRSKQPNAISAASSASELRLTITSGSSRRERRITSGYRPEPSQ